MPDSNFEVQLARVDERLKLLNTQHELDRQDRKTMEATLLEQSKLLVTINSRVEKVEAALAVATPTLEQFVALKHQVTGAGFLGRWIWVILGGLIATVYSARNEIGSWLSRN